MVRSDTLVNSESPQCVSQVWEINEADIQLTSRTRPFLPDVHGGFEWRWPIGSCSAGLIRVRGNATRFTRRLLIGAFLNLTLRRRGGTGPNICITTALDRRELRPLFPTRNAKDVAVDFAEFFRSERIFYFHNRIGLVDIA